MIRFFCFLLLFLLSPATYGDELSQLLDAIEEPDGLVVGGESALSDLERFVVDVDVNGGLPEVEEAPESPVESNQSSASTTSSSPVSSTGEPSEVANTQPSSSKNNIGNRSAGSNVYYVPMGRGGAPENSGFEYRRPSNPREVRFKSSQVPAYKGSQGFEAKPIFENSSQSETQMSDPRKSVAVPQESNQSGELEHKTTRSQSRPLINGRGQVLAPSPKAEQQSVQNLSNKPRQVKTYLEQARKQKKEKQKSVVDKLKNLLASLGAGQLLGVDKGPSVGNSHVRGQGRGVATNSKQALKTPEQVLRERYAAHMRKFNGKNEVGQVHLGIFFRICQAYNDLETSMDMPGGSHHERCPLD